MDINSVEFYTLAFVVAMSLIALLMGRSEKKPPSTHILQLDTTTTEDDEEDTLTMEATGGGNVSVRRTGLSIANGETVNLVITLQEDHCTIIEKKGIKRRGSPNEAVNGQATLTCLRPGSRYRIRYESQVTSAWATFTFDTSSPTPKQVTLTY